MVKILEKTEELGNCTNGLTTEITRLFIELHSKAESRGGRTGTENLTNFKHCATAD
jgi:hypothetical protein